MNIEKAIALDSGGSGRDHYEAVYLDALERQAEWLRRGAGQKADSVEQLLHRNGIKPESVLELGCGTGAVIGELQQRALAQHYYGIDYSATAIAYLKTAFPTIQCTVADVMETANVFDKDSFDVVICSHIIEHLEDPVSFLQAIGQRFQFEYLVVEVPLEDLFFGRAKALLKDRSKNSAGHVHFFFRAVAFIRLSRLCRTQLSMSESMRRALTRKHCSLPTANMVCYATSAKCLQSIICQSMPRTCGRGGIMPTMRCFAKETV